jgi:transposase
MPITEKDKYVIIYLHEKGFTNTYITKELDISHETVKRWIDRYYETNNIDRKSGSGRSRITSEIEDKIITECFKNDKYQYVPEIKKKLMI